MGTSLARGYATAGTDTGHEGSDSDASFALGHPEKLTDFAYRAVHETTVKAKAVVAVYYGQAPRLSYWNGCSSGGKQGLKEAQRFPADYDGIIAEAPANHWTHLAAQIVWAAQAVHLETASYIPPSKYPLIHNAVLEACDARDGVLEDPARCQFDPGALICTSAQGPSCLTAPQVSALRKVYGAATNPRTKQQVYPGTALGSELGWEPLLGPQPFQIAVDHWKYVVFRDPMWDYRTLNLDSHVGLADKVDNGAINATDPNLKAFFTRGGKLPQYHGWGDPLISPMSSIEYYQRVATALTTVSSECWQPDPAQ